MVRRRSVRRERVKEDADDRKRRKNARKGLKKVKMKGSGKPEKSKKRGRRRKGGGH